MNHRGFVFGILSRNDKVGSKIIRARTWSRWSHVAMLLDDEVVLESVAAHGVRLRALKALKQDSTDWVIFAIPCPQANLVRNFAKGQLGKPYDILWALGLGINRDWQDDDKWGCSEIFAWPFQQAGYPIFRAEEVHAITPQDIWRIPFEVVSRKV